MARWCHSLSLHSTALPFYFLCCPMRLVKQVLHSAFLKSPLNCSSWKWKTWYCSIGTFRIHCSLKRSQCAINTFAVPWRVRRRQKQILLNLWMNTRGPSLLHALWITCVHSSSWYFPSHLLFWGTLRTRGRSQVGEIILPEASFVCCTLWFSL